jgi:hypothetical protein
MPRPEDLDDPEAALLGVERLSPEEEAEQEKAQAEKRELRKALLIGLMESADFRAWLMEKLTAFETFTMPFGAGPTGFPDTNATFYALGMKAAGWNIWEEFDAMCPELASKMRRGI